MRKIGLVDESFVGDLGASKYHPPDYFVWDRSGGTRDIVVFSDLCYDYAKLPLYRDSRRIAWLLEPIAINQNSYRYILENYKDFHTVISHNNEFLSKIPNGRWVSPGMCWIYPKDWAIYNKTKDVSIIASRQNFAVGHLLRHRLIKEGLKADVYGYAYKPIEYKLEALRDYKYSVTIENSIQNLYYTEKIIDCFLTGTLPLYWGTKYVTEIFDPKGICFIGENPTAQSVNSIIDQLLKANAYEASMEAIKNNFRIAQDHVAPENYMAKYIL